MSGGDTQTGYQYTPGRFLDIDNKENFTPNLLKVAWTRLAYLGLQEPAPLAEVEEGLNLKLVICHSS